MTIHNLGLENSVLNQFVLELRDVTIQKDSMRFRRNVERIGEILGYELSKTLEFVHKTVQTSLGEQKTLVPVEEIVLCAILRAGLPLHNGLLNYFDKAENAFISAYRDHKRDSDDFDIVVNYLASPRLENKTLILADPMLATGKTLENTLQAMKGHGTPKQIHIVSVIGSKLGLGTLKKYFPRIHIYGLQR